MRRQMLQKKSTSRPRDERAPALVLPLDPRDPDVVRAKRLLRDRGDASGRDRRAG